jgi:hypothetical protein
MMARFGTRRQNSSATTTDDHPLQYPLQFSSLTALGGVRRLRDTLMFKNARSARADREFLKKESRCTRPLTGKNIDALLTEQDQYDARHSLERTTEVQVSEWLRQLP